MNIGSYYHILEMGLVYEKGQKRGRFWRVGERKRLRDECILWENILKYIALEGNKQDCTTMIYNDLCQIAQKYGLLNYQRVVSLWKELQEADHVVEYRMADVCFVNDFMNVLLKDLEEELKRIKGKPNAYRIMGAMHHFPRVFYGKDVLGAGKMISLEDAKEYSLWSMTENMKEKYSGYF